MDLLCNYFKLLFIKSIIDTESGFTACSTYLTHKDKARKCFCTAPMLQTAGIQVV